MAHSGIGGISLPPGAKSGSPLMGPDGKPLMTEAAKREAREEHRDMVMLSIAKSLQVIAQGVSEGFPRFDAIGVAQANALGAIAMGMGNLGLVDVPEDEEAADTPTTPTDVPAG